MSVTKHASRAADPLSRSIDFISHSPVSQHRLRGEGTGTFPNVDFGWPQRRLGTSSQGHGRHYLVSEFVKKANDAHYQVSFAKKTETPKAFNITRTEFTNLVESTGETNRITRPSNFTMKAMQDNYKRLI